MAFYGWAQGSSQQYDNKKDVGFQSGEVILASEINAAVKQANNVAAAIGNILAPNDNFETTEATLRNDFKEGLRFYIHEIFVQTSVDDNSVKFVISVFDKNSTPITKSNFFNRARACHFGDPQARTFYRATGLVSGSENIVFIALEPGPNQQDIYVYDISGEICSGALNLSEDDVVTDHIRYGG